MRFGVHSVHGRATGNSLAEHTFCATIIQSSALLLCLYFSTTIRRSGTDGRGAAPRFVSSRRGEMSRSQQDTSTGELERMVAVQCFARKCKYTDDDHVVRIFQFVPVIIFIIIQVLTTRQEANNSYTLSSSTCVSRPVLRAQRWRLSGTVVILNLYWSVNYTQHPENATHPLIAE